MPVVALHNMAGEQVGELELRADVFGVAPNVGLMHQAVVTEQANSRQGTSSTKTRSEVRGGGAKPWRQKGTGRARQGSIRAIQWAHGGVAFGPTPRSYRQSLPRKMRRGAVRSALSARLTDEAIVVLDEIKLDKIGTRQMEELLDTFDAYGRTLVVLDEMTEEVSKSSRNIPGVDLRLSPAVSCRDILNAERILMTRTAVERLQEALTR